MRALVSLAAAGLVVLAACGPGFNRPAQLLEAEQLYERLQQQGVAQRAEAELIRAGVALDSARAVAIQARNQPFADAVAHIALRRVQTAQAEHRLALAEMATDSLRTARLQRLLTLTEAQREALARQQRLSEEEISMLRVQRSAAEQQADSLRRAVEEANARLNQALAQLRELVTEITNIRETQRGLVINLSDILFDVDQARLRAGALANVRRISALLNQFPEYQIAVEGHTDATGSASYNQQLSERRAAAVREALVEGGVDPGRITSRGFGLTQPIATNDTPAGRQQNRRVEVIVLGAGAMAQRQGQDTTGAPGVTPPPGGQQQPDTTRAGQPPGL